MLSTLLRIVVGLAGLLLATFLLGGLAELSAGPGFAVFVRKSVLFGGTFAFAGFLVARRLGRPVAPP